MMWVWFACVHHGTCTVTLIIMDETFKKWNHGWQRPHKFKSVFVTLLSL